jgi:hypothetical protein
MTASKSPEPEPRRDAEIAPEATPETEPKAETKPKPETKPEIGTTADLESATEPVDGRHDDATTEILAGLDADTRRAESINAERDAQTTELLPETAITGKFGVLPKTADTHTTAALPEPADTHTTAVLPETRGWGGSASSEASASRPEAPADLTPPPAPATSTPAAGPLTAEPALRARVRWAGIIWGLVFAAAAVTMIWVLAEPERRESVDLWWAGLTPAGLGLTALIVAGGLLLIGGLTGLARHLSARTGA